MLLEKIGIFPIYLTVDPGQTGYGPSPHGLCIFGVTGRAAVVGCWEDLIAVNGQQPSRCFGCCFLQLGFHLGKLIPIEFLPLFQIVVSLMPAWIGGEGNLFRRSTHDRQSIAVGCHHLGNAGLLVPGAGQFSSCHAFEVFHRCYLDFLPLFIQDGIAGRQQCLRLCCLRGCFFCCRFRSGRSTAFHWGRRHGLIFGGQCAQGRQCQHEHGGNQQIKQQFFHGNILSDRDHLCLHASHSERIWT